MMLAGRTGRYMYGVDEHFVNRWKIFSCTLIRYQTEAATQLLGRDLVDHVAGEFLLLEVLLRFGCLRRLLL